MNTSTNQNIFIEDDEMKLNKSNSYEHNGMRIGNFAVDGVLSVEFIEATIPDQINDPSKVKEAIKESNKAFDKLIEDIKQIPTAEEVGNILSKYNL